MDVIWAEESVDVWFGTAGTPGENDEGLTLFVFTSTAFETCVSTVGVSSNCLLLSTDCLSSSCLAPGHNRLEMLGLGEANFLSGSVFESPSLTIGRSDFLSASGFRDTCSVSMLFLSGTLLGVGLVDSVVVDLQASLDWHLPPPLAGVASEHPDILAT